MATAIDKIKAMAQQAADTKLADEKKKIEERVQKDLDVLDEIVKLVSSRLIYKEVPTGYGSRKRYEVVTEDMVFEDFTTKDDKSYNYGTKIEKVQNSWYNVEHTKITVNGHVYYHAADLFKRYRWEIEKSIEKTQQELDNLNSKKDHLANLEQLEPAVKAIMLDYQNNEALHPEAKVEA